MNTGRVHYHLCPHCLRAVPEAAGEVYCPNDGTPLLSACPHCDAPISSPYARFCVVCGRAYTLEEGGKEPAAEPRRA